MNETTTIDCIKAILRFPFRQEGWQRSFLIGSALVFAGFFIPIVPWIPVAGYAARVIALMIGGKPLNLPNWDNWGELFSSGTRVIAISLAYTAPGLAILCSGLVLNAAAGVLPAILIPLLGDEPAVGILYMFAMLSGTAILLLSMSLGTVLMVAGYLPLPLAVAHAIAEDRLAAAFRIKEWHRYLRCDRLGYLVGWVLVAGLSSMLYGGLVLLTYTLVLCMVVPFIAAPVSVYLSLVGAAFFGQFYTQARQAAGVEETTGGE